jgi:hypothetical protein
MKNEANAASEIGIIKLINNLLNFYVSIGNQQYCNTPDNKIFNYHQNVSPNGATP